MDPDINNQNSPAPNAPPANNSTPPSPDGQNQAPMVGGSEKNNKKMWLWIIIVLAVLLIAFFGWWWMDKDKKSTANTNASTEQQEEAVAVTCAADFTAYENTDLDLGFCYPTAWGTITVADARLQQTATEVDGVAIAADTGQRWLVSFSEKPAVNLGVVTDDWSTEVGRDGTCVDPAIQTLPAFSPFATTWETEGTPVSFATRGIEVLADNYLIQETVDDLLTNGVCVVGYTIINADAYTHTAASYSVEFAAPVTTPQLHIDDPNVLITETNRNDFYTFVKSVHSL